MDERVRPLVLALGGLAVLQTLHLLDSLRTDDTTSFPGVLLSPQGVAGIGGTVLALVLVARGHAWGRPLALTAGVLVALGFVVVHGLPFASDATEPYWGDGSADALQWLGVLSILATAAVVVRLARERTTVVREATA